MPEATPRVEDAEQAEWDAIQRTAPSSDQIRSIAKYLLETGQAATGPQGDLLRRTALYCSLDIMAHDRRPIGDLEAKKLREAARIIEASLPIAVSERRCATCQWFQPLAHNQIEVAQGACHYSPPDRPGGFPLVHKNDWCRCWSPTVQEPEHE